MGDTTNNNGKHPKTHWQLHDIALLFPSMNQEERAAMKKDMKERAEQGLPPWITPSCFTRIRSSMGVTKMRFGSNSLKRMRVAAFLQ